MVVTSAAAAVLLAGATIVLPALNATNCLEWKAANELHTELALLTGVPSPPIQHEPYDAPGVFVLVGNTSARHWQLPAIANLSDQERVVAVSQGNLFVFGDDTGAPNLGASNEECGARLGDKLPECLLDHWTCRGGTLNAAHALLSEELGMRWVWPGADGTVRPPPNATLSVGGLMSRSTPSLAARQMRNNPASYVPASEVIKALPWFNATRARASFLEESEWSVRLALGGQELPPWGQAFEKWWGDFGAEEPELFALQPDGSRGCQHMENCGAPQDVKMDVTQPELWGKLAAAVDHDHPLGVSACEDDDTGGFCTCDKCTALDPPERAGTKGSFSDRYAYFWSQVAKKLREQGKPDAWVTGYAYMNYSMAPVHTNMDPDNNSNILILMADWPTKQPALPNETKPWSDAWAGWVKSGARAMAMRPNTFWSGYTSMPYMCTFRSHPHHTPPPHTPTHSRGLCLLLCRHSEFGVRLHVRPDAQRSGHDLLVVREAAHDAPRQRVVAGRDDRLHGEAEAEGEQGEPPRARHVSRAHCVAHL